MVSQIFGSVCSHSTHKLWTPSLTSMMFSQPVCLLLYAEVTGIGWLGYSPFLSVSPFISVFFKQVYVLDGSGAPILTENQGCPALFHEIPSTHNTHTSKRRDLLKGTF